MYFDLAITRIHAVVGGFHLSGAANEQIIGKQRHLSPHKTFHQNSHHTSHQTYNENKPLIHLSPHLSLHLSLHLLSNLSTNQCMLDVYIVPHHTKSLIKLLTTPLTKRHHTTFNTHLGCLYYHPMQNKWSNAMLNFCRLSALLGQTFF